ncbi:MAG TPA: hypothetical protein VGR02_15280, partial [Thermoanaerobaculia bacterium]|nr:hypothetical protein [Thermoanaerobaculia bacterium]
MTVVPPPPPRRTNNGILIGSAAGVVLLLVLGWLFLIGLPFGRPETLQRTQTVVSTATISEDTAPVGPPDLGVPAAPTPTPAPAPITLTAPPP